MIGSLAWIMSDAAMCSQGQAELMMAKRWKCADSAIINGGQNEVRIPDAGILTPEILKHYHRASGNGRSAATMSRQSAT
jgi:hypothetical protein